MANHTLAKPAAEPQLCHSCRTNPIADKADARVTNMRLLRMARDENKAVAHIAAAALAHGYDARAWDRIAARAQDPNDLSNARRNAAIHREVSQQLAVVAQDAQAVTQ